MIERELLEYVRYQLIQQMENLHGAASRTANRMKSETENLADIFDQAAAEHDRGLELAIRERENQKIRDIRETILRIDRGQFGICARCRREIPPKRLLHAPMSRLCLSCKTKMELQKNYGCRYVPDKRISENYAA